MKNFETNNQKIIERKYDNFKHLMLGAKFAKISTVVLIAFSIGLMYLSRENMVGVFTLLFGILFLLFYFFKYLAVQGINPDPTNTQELSTNLSKFKTYFEKRKKNEVLFLVIWLLSGIPAASTYFGSELKVAISLVTYIAFVGVFGYLAFRKIEKEIRFLEAEIQ